jgi:hypothetical protein
MFARNLHQDHNANAGRRAIAHGDAGDPDRDPWRDELGGEVDLAFLPKTRVSTTPAELQVTITDQAGREILSSAVDGPTLVHAHLAQGTYTVIARSDHVIKLRDFEVLPGRTGRVLIEWDV